MCPRIYIDPNRDVGDLDPTMLDGPWPDAPVPGRKTELGVGLIWRIMPPDVRLYDRLLGADEVRNPIRRRWKPSHRAVAPARDEPHTPFAQGWTGNGPPKPRWDKRRVGK